MSTTQFPKIIHDPYGDDYVLADSEAEALEEAQGNDDAAERVESVGWMCRVAYPDEYGSREEWEQSPNFTDEWWEGCQTPVNDKQRAHAKQAWRIVYAS